MKKTVGILAHVDAGKTTFAESVLYHTKSIREKGRVDHKNSFLDNHSIEKSRGITIFSDIGRFEYNESTYYLVDTPGHVDFSTEMERALSIMDYAIVIISGVQGLQSHNEILWRLLIKNNIPTFFFINKMDQPGAELDRVITDISKKLTKDIVSIDDSYNSGEMGKELIEFIAERDEELLERYIDENYDNRLWCESFRKLIKGNQVFPLMSGSALQDNGVIEFLEKFDELTYCEYSDDSAFGGRVFKIRYDENGDRITYIKSMKGTLRVKDEIAYSGIDSQVHEKVNQIRIYNGKKYELRDTITSGEVFGVTGISDVKPGAGVGCITDNVSFEIVPTLRARVIFDASLNDREVLRCFRILQGEDPALRVEWDEKLKLIQVHIMGTIQLEVLTEIMSDRFGIYVSFGPSEVVYKETIADLAAGCGHFEPLKHYAEVHLRLKPGERNSGLVFINACHTEDLTTGYQNLIRTHLFEREHHGVLTGSSITDMEITLITGRDHLKHTHGGDFREATIRALRQGLEQVENILLEPYYSFRMDVELIHMGRVISDVQRLHGSFEPPETSEDNVVIRGRGPVATFMNYSLELIGFTKGKGILSLNYDGYDICHNTEEVIKRIGYDPTRDPEYTSNSIFCAKGQAYSVTGDVAQEYMHCILE